jgi:hypothetical protein
MHVQLLVTGFNEFHVYIFIVICTDQVSMRVHTSLSASIWFLYGGGGRLVIYSLTQFHTFHFHLIHYILLIPKEVL